MQSCGRTHIRSYPQLNINVNRNSTYMQNSTFMQTCGAAHLVFYRIPTFMLSFYIYVELRFSTFSVLPHSYIYVEIYFESTLLSFYDKICYCSATRDPTASRLTLMRSLDPDLALRVHPVSARPSGRTQQSSRLLV